MKAQNFVRLLVEFLDLTAVKLFTLGLSEDAPS